MTPLITEIHVGINFGDSTIPVGRLAIRNHKIYFQYHESFIQKKLEISPFHLPLQRNLVEFDPRLFEGLAGVFNDSLPDGWGRLLLDRFLRSHNILPADITPLDRLTNVGRAGLGALVYEPDHHIKDNDTMIDLDKLAQDAQDVMKGAPVEVIENLLALNGSSAGARAKALIGLDKKRRNIIHGISDLDSDYQHWIVKFPNNQDGDDAGAIEYVYALMAKEAGIISPDIHLFPTNQNPGYFAVKRFDREGHKRIHTHTACGLCHSDFRSHLLDYKDLIGLTLTLTADINEVEKIYRLGVFNVLAHNRDDHGKNFSFLMDAQGQWGFAPAYDLTFSSGPGGEQSMTVMGEGRNPQIEHLVQLGLEAQLSKPKIQQVIDQTKTALATWRRLASIHHVSQDNIDIIEKRIHQK